MIMTAIIGRERGSTIFVMIFMLPQPSIKAASCISYGKLSKKERITIMLYTFTIPGIIMTHGVLMRLISLYTRYVGIRPPLKNIVKVNTIEMTFLPTKSLRESGYAMAIVPTRFNSVPATV